MWKYLFVLVAAGCATTSGPQKVGPDSYMISVNAKVGSETGMRTAALEQANTHCASINREILVFNLDTQSGEYGAAGQVTYKCLAAGDPELGN